MTTVLPLLCLSACPYDDVDDKRNVSMRLEIAVRFRWFRVSVPFHLPSRYCCVPVASRMRLNNFDKPRAIPFLAILLWWSGEASCAHTHQPCRAASPLPAKKKKNFVSVVPGHHNWIPVKIVIKMFTVLQPNTDPGVGILLLFCALRNGLRQCTRVWLHFVQNYELRQ